MLSQHLVDDALVVAAASAFDLISEPGQDFVIESATVKYYVFMTATNCESNEGAAAQPYINEAEVARPRGRSKNFFYRF